MGAAVAVLVRAVEFLLLGGGMHFIQQRQQLALGVRGEINGEGAVFIA